LIRKLNGKKGSSSETACFQKRIGGMGIYEGVEIESKNTVRKHFQIAQKDLSGFVEHTLTVRGKKRKKKT